MKKIKAGIIGGAGYTGGELVRLLVNHTGVEIVFVHSKSNAGKQIQEVHKDLMVDMVFASEIHGAIDVLFLCVAHGDSVKFLEENTIPDHVRIISLSQDFRLEKNSVFQNRKFVYGLPEVYKKEIIASHDIANPGCFATAIELALLPMAKEGWLTDVYATGITGSTGAGQSMSETSHFSWRENNVQAYKSLAHQHISEIRETLEATGENEALESSIHFVPWRGNFTRGIFITAQLKCEETLTEIYRTYEKFYAGHPFIKISKEPIFLKQVVNTNNCFINIEKVGDIVVIHSAIDNLLKGASGQAVQNMNLMFGLDESEGLRLKANYF